MFNGGGHKKIYGLRAVNHILIGRKYATYES